VTGGIRFDVNLSILFTELPLLERPAAAAAAGFTAAELWWPFPEPDPPGARLDELAESLGAAGLSLVGLNFDAGDLAAGERGLVSLPGAGDRFADNVECAVAFAGSQGCRVLNALYGNRVEGVAPELQDETALGRLILAASAAARIGAQVVIETQNRVDSPRYPIRSAEQAVAVARLVRDAGQANVGFLCDFYHLAMEGADLDEVVDAYGSWIDHVQVADAPGRHEPGTGQIAFPALLAHLGARGYEGWVGCEYRPSGPSAESFAWMARYEAQDSIEEESGGAPV
jgi:hydroxypyruvate isomerase